MKDDHKTKKQLIDELAEMRQQVASFRALEAKPLQNALYQISQAADTSAGLDDLYSAIHQIIQNIMPAANFYVAIHDEKEDLLSFPYFVDQVDGPASTVKLGNGLTEYVLRTGKSLLCDTSMHEELTRRGEADLIGAPSLIWLGIPLTIDRKTIGVMVVQHYTNQEAYGIREQHMLEFVSSQVTKAIVRKKAEEDLAESQRRMTAFMDASTDSFHLLDSNLKILEINKPAVDAIVEVLPHIHGKADLLGVHFFEIYPFLGDSGWETQFMQVIELGKPMRREFMAPHEVRGDRCLSVQIFKVDEGVGLIASDITEQKRSEEALRESEERFRSIFETTAVSIWEEDFSEVKSAIDEVKALGVTDFRGYLEEHPEFLSKASQMVKVVDVNEATLKMFGATSKIEMMGSLDKVFVPETLDILREEIIAIAEGETYLEGETINQTLAGKRLNIWLTMSIPTESTKFGSVLVSMMDITERKQAEGELLDQMRRNELILRTTMDGFILADTHGELIDVNPAYCEMIGYSRHELLEMNMRDLDVELLPGEIKQRFRELVRTGTLHFETRHRQKNGAVIDLDVSIALMQTEKKPLVISFVRDITERVKAELERERLVTQIREGARQLGQVMDTVPEGVLLLDSNGVIVLANPVAQNDLEVLTKPQYGEAITQLGDRTLQQLLAPPLQGFWHEVTSGERLFEVIARPVEGYLEDQHWVMIIKEVTQERETQKRIHQQEQLASIGQLAAGIAHDFNNIMATIVLYAQMTMLESDLPSFIHARMTTIDQQAQHATRLIQQILDFSRRAVLEKQALDLLPLIKEQVKLLKRTLPENISISFAHSRDNYVVHADPTRMQQMVTNLAVNARDAMPLGGEFHINLDRIQFQDKERAPLPEMEDGEWVLITASDTGSGIRPEILPKIFEPFFTTKAPLGSGLGLSQVHGIVAQHNGHIDVNTQVEKGTTFAIYLPAISIQPATDHTSEFPALEKGNAQTILVVEDEEAVRMALVDSLEALNYQGLEAANGNDALEVFERHPSQIDMVLSDVIMPEMGGVALYHALRKNDSQVPVILMTGHPMEKELKELREYGLDGWLLKPLKLEQLARALANVFNS